VKISIFLSLSRQLLFLLPFIWVLPQFWGLNGVWYALPASDTTAAVVTAAIMFYFMPKLKRQHHGE
jgi:Na+-driven multidrug efflux pump